MVTKYEIEKTNTNTTHELQNKNKAKLTHKDEYK
jgi:hypothetical protein